MCCRSWVAVPPLLLASVAATGAAGLLAPKRLYGLVYTRDSWWMRLGLGIVNGLQGMRRCSFRVFVHPTQAVETILQQNGLRRRFYRLAGVWQIAIYARAS
jgi:hypothetical protein